MRPNGRGRAWAGGFLSLLVAAEAVCDDVAVHDNQCTWRTCIICISALLVQIRTYKHLNMSEIAWNPKGEPRTFAALPSFVETRLMWARKECLSLHFQAILIHFVSRRPNTSRNTATTVAVTLPKGAATSAGPIAPQAKETRMAEHDLRAPTTCFVNVGSVTSFLKYVWYKSRHGLGKSLFLHKMLFEINMLLKQVVFRFLIKHQKVRCPSKSSRLLWWSRLSQVIFYLITLCGCGL